MPSDNDPFIAGPIIDDSQYFVGYQDQLKTITDRAIAPQPTSLNVIGVKRIGKSSLLKHFCRTYIDKIQNRGQDPKKYLAVYIDLKQDNCRSKSGFFQVVAENLKRNLEQNYAWYGQPDILIQALTANSFDTDNFNQAIVKFRDQGILPIICLDKIETLLKHPDEFKDDFYDNLRFLMGLNSLMLVIASEKTIKIYRNQKKATAQDIENIIPKALEVGGAYFNEFWDNSLNEAEREFIRDLINNGSPMEKAPVVGNKLIDKDILKLDDNNQLHFRVPLIERSFTQKIEQES